MSLAADNLKIDTSAACRSPGVQVQSDRVCGLRWLQQLHAPGPAPLFVVLG